MHAFLLINQRLDELHYAAMSTMGCSDLLKPPVTLRQPWRQIDRQALSEANLQVIFDWFDRFAEPNDFLVIEGNDEAIEPVLARARTMGLIAMRPVWQPAPAFIPLIAEDSDQG